MSLMGRPFGIPVPLGRVLIAVIGLALACGEPRAFRVVSVDDARSLLLTPGASVIDTGGEPDAIPGGIPYSVPEVGDSVALELPPGPVLVVASSHASGLRTAAALTRAGNRSVVLFIPASAEERQSLYALASEMRGDSGDKDS